MTGNTASLTTGNTNTERQNAARCRAEYLASHIIPLRDAGKSIREIAAAMTASGIPTALGGAWGPSQVLRLLRRLEEQPAGGMVIPEHHDPLCDLIVTPSAAPAVEEDSDPLATGPIWIPA